MAKVMAASKAKRKSEMAAAKPAKMKNINHGENMSEEIWRAGS